MARVMVCVHGMVEGIVSVERRVNQMGVKTHFGKGVMPVAESLDTR